MKNILVLFLMSCLLVACGNKKGEGTKSGPVETNFPPRQMTYPLNSYTFSNQIEIDDIYPNYFGGLASVFTISPSLPTGLHFSSLSGRIAGTPEVERAAQVYTITASNSFGATSYPITIKVQAQEPFGLRYVTDELDLLRNSNSISLIPESNAGTRGGAVITSYSISPSALPTGLVFNTANGYIEGIPSEVFPRTVYTITGSNSAGSVSTTLAITVSTLYSELASGGQHNCILMDETPYCWGNNNYGQLGNGNNSSSPVPVPVAGFSGTARSFVLGSDHSCMLNDSLDVYCFGRNQSGQLGSDIVGDKNVATLFDALGKMNLISTSKDTFAGVGANYHSCGSGLIEENLFCWGSYDFGNFSSQGYIPKFDADLTDVPQVSYIASGSNYTCFIYNSAVYCLGDNSFGQLGRVGGNSVNAVAVTGMESGVPLLTAGHSFACGLKDEQVYCWGDNSQKQLANASFVGASSASALLTENMPVGSVVSLVSGKEFACSLINSKVYCWGSNSHGQLGNGLVAANSATPVVVKLANDSELDQVTSISAGENHACAISNNQVYCWGDNSSRQVNNSSTLTFNKAVEGL